MAPAVRKLLAGQAQRAVNDVDSSIGPGLADEAADEAVRQRTDIGPTQKKKLVHASRAQDVYRANLTCVEKVCRLTGVSVLRHLRASHVKPWCVG